MVERSSIYRMLFEGIRKFDGYEMGLLQKFCDMLDEAWEDYIYNRASDLPTLFEVENISSQWLKLLSPILGFTRNLSFDATEEELRRILSNAVPFWNDKPSELGSIQHAIRMVTGNRFRVRDFFDFRIVADETCLGEEGEDLDPWIIDFWGRTAKGLEIKFNDATSFEITSALPEGEFKTKYDYRWLVVDAGESGAGSYPIQECTPYSVSGKLARAFPGSIPVTVAGALYGSMDEYLTEIRVVDQGNGSITCSDVTTPFVIGEIIRGETSGALASVVGTTFVVGTTWDIMFTRLVGRFVDAELVQGHHGGEGRIKGKHRGVLNRDLVKFLLSQNRPLSERYDVRYISFLDQFLTINDLDQWSYSGEVLVPAPGGHATMLAGSTITPDVELAVLEDNDSDGIYEVGWENYTILFVLIPLSADNVFDLRFRIIDPNNFFIVRWDAGLRKLDLIKVVIGIESLIASTTLTYLKPLVQFCVRIDAFTQDLGSPITKIRVCVDGQPIFSPEWQEDTAPTHRGGPIAIYNALGALEIKMVEVSTWPSEIEHVGPPPDPPRRFAYHSGWSLWGT